MNDPVGYYCDHSDEPTGARTHHKWNLVDDQGWIFQHQPNTISAHAGLQEYLTSEQQKQRCPRAVAVYTADVVEQARRIGVELEAQLALATELRIPKANGDELVILRHGANADQWSIKDGGRAFRAWVNGQWRQLSDISLDDTVTYPLHEALDIARQLATEASS